MAHFLTFSSLSLLVAAGISIASAGDWPQWRGPNRDGHSSDTGLLAQWPADGPKLVWKQTGLGGGYSTPSVAGGKIFGAGYRGEDEYVWALDAVSGKEIWSTKTTSAERGVGYPDGPRSTPTIDGDHLYSLSAGGNLVCLETATGKEKWHKSFKEEFGGRMMSGWGFSESPLVDGDNVISTPGGTKGSIVALNKKTGEVVWQTKDFTDRAAYSSLTIADFGGVRQYVQMTDQHVVGVGAKDGAILWKADRMGKTAVIPTPIIYENFVFVTSGYGVGCNLFKITSEGGAFKAEEVYANKDLINHHGGVVRLGDHVYGHSDSKGWVCMELKTGKLKWNNQGVGKGAVSFADGKLYARSEKTGTVALIDASPEGYKEESHLSQPDRSSKSAWPHPVIANGRLYLRDQDALFCYDVKGN